MLKVCRRVCVCACVCCACVCVLVCCHLGAAPHVYYNTHTPARLPVIEQVERNIRCSSSRWLTPHFRSSSRETNCKIISRDELKSERQVAAFSSPVLPALMLSLHSIVCVCVWLCVFWRTVENNRCKMAPCQWDTKCFDVRSAVHGHRKCLSVRLMCAFLLFVLLWSGRRILIGWEGLVTKVTQLAHATPELRDLHATTFASYWTNHLSRTRHVTHWIRSPVQQAGENIYEKKKN